MIQVQRSLRLSMILISLSLPALATASRLVSMNDVSILLPFPENLADAALLRPATVGALGELLPREVFNRVPRLTFALPAEKLYENLRVVSIRLDPCFSDFPSPSPSECIPQIRMVWQPFLVSPEGRALSAADSAIHTFYELSPEKFTALLAQLPRLRHARDRGAPLQVHPAIAREGYRGPYWRTLRSVLLSATGDANFVRLTFMTSGANGSLWTFGGFDRQRDGAWRELVINGTSVTQQNFASNAVPAVEFLGGPSSDSTHPDALQLVISRSKYLTLENHAPELKRTARAVDRLENPRIHAAGSIDCVSCHTAQSARLWIGRRFPQFLDPADRFVSRQNLRNVSTEPGSTNNLRAFGYQWANPAISQRTIHETAAVVESLNARLAESN